MSIIVRKINKLQTKRKKMQLYECCQTKNTSVCSEERCTLCRCNGHGFGILSWTGEIHPTFCCGSISKNALRKLQILKNMLTKDSKSEETATMILKEHLRPMLVFSCHVHECYVKGCTEVSPRRSKGFGYRECDYHVEPRKALREKHDEFKDLKCSGKQNVVITIHNEYDHEKKDCDGPIGRKTRRKLHVIHSIVRFHNICDDVFKHELLQFLDPNDFSCTDCQCSKPGCSLPKDTDSDFYCKKHEYGYK